MVSMKVIGAVFLVNMFNQLLGYVPLRMLLKYAVSQSCGLIEYSFTESQSNCFNQENGN